MGTQIRQWKQTLSFSHWHSSNVSSAVPQIGTNSKYIAKACELGDNQRSHAKRSTQVRTTFRDGYFSHDRWETFMSSGASSSSSFSSSETRGFEGVATSSAMTKFSPTLIKTKRVAETMGYLHIERVEVFLFNKLR